MSEKKGSSRSAKQEIAQGSFRFGFLGGNSIGQLVEIKLDTNAQYFPSASSLVYFCISLINLSSPRAFSMASDLKVGGSVPR